MKKRLFLISLLALLLLVGCDGSSWSKTIKAQAYPSMNVLELKVGARQNGGEYAAYAEPSSSRSFRRGRWCGRRK